MTENGQKPTFAAILWSFMKLSPVSFGGGYAILPALEREWATKRRWMESEEIADTLSLAAAAPGGVAINAALLLGYRLKGTPGAVAAAIGSILPTFLIVLGVFALYSNFADSPKLQGALTGVVWGIISLILFSAWRVARSALQDPFALLLSAGALLGLLAGLSPVLFIVAGIAIGAGSYRFVRKIKRWRLHAERARTGGKPAPAVEPTYMYYI